MEGLRGDGSVWHSVWEKTTAAAHSRHRGAERLHTNIETPAHKEML